MKKKLILIISLFTLILFSFAGCRSTGSESSAASEAASGGQTSSIAASGGTVSGGQSSSISGLTSTVSNVS